MMNPQATLADGDGSDDHAGRRRALLHAALAPLADELRLVDCADLLATVLRGQFANVDDLMQSSLEPFFAPDSFSFGWAADAVLGWADPPELCFEMEFAAPGLTVFFALRLLCARHEVEIRLVAFDAGGSPDENTGRLAAALAAARRPQAPDKSAAAG